MPLRLGKFTLHEVRDGNFALDGGAMFGVVPKPLWEKKLPADERNRVSLALRCLLIANGSRRILVDTGIGNQWNEKQRDIYKIDHSTCDLDGDLERAGVGREQITDVVLTHLHFDHAGGAVRVDRGAPALTFPNAIHHLQRRNWEWAHQATEKDSGSFRAETFELIKDKGRLHLCDGGWELCPGVEVFLSEGHTIGLQLVRVTDANQSIVYCADLIPTAAHLKSSWGMAYDLFPLTVIQEKKKLLDEAVHRGWTLFFEHDPEVAACTVKKDKGEAVIAEVVAF